MYCLNLLAIAMELANEEPCYEDVASKLDEQEFLSPYGIRGISRFHHAHPYMLQVSGTEYRVDYEPGESSTGLFVQVECPTLWEVAGEISRRMTRIFLQGEDGHRPVHGPNALYREDPNWRDLVLFYEYFHGDSGAGVGASHQTGWTGVVAKLLQQSGE